MRIAFLLFLLAILLFVLVPGSGRPSAQPEEPTYSSVAEALRDWESQRHGWLSPPATIYLLQALGLNWGFTRGPAYTHWEGVCIYTSESREYAVMIRANAGEWGQFGRARYCLIDSSGMIHWERPGFVDAPPLVSNQGTVALRYGDGTAGDRRDWTTLRIDFIGLAGDSLGSIRWADRIRRPVQRRFLEEESFFTPDGGLFITTMNRSDRLADRRATETNNTFVYAVRTDGSVAWQHYLAGFWPKSMRFRGDSGDILLEGEWVARLVLNESFDEGHFVFGLDGRSLEKTVTRHVEAPIAPE
jgi:outer membrane protein assembly factor BamB